MTVQDERIAGVVEDPEPPVLRLWERRGLLRPGRHPTNRYRVYDPAEQRAAHLVAVLRAGGFAFPIIDAAIATMRASGSLEHTLGHLSRRAEQVTTSASAACGPRPHCTPIWRSTIHRSNSAVTQCRPPITDQRGVRCASLHLDRLAGSG